MDGYTNTWRTAEGITKTEEKAPVTGLTRKTAEQQARNVRSYWLERGYDVKAWAEPITMVFKGKKRTFFVVRSDLVNGNPTRKIS